jgi:hypothetical protein
MVAVVGQIAHPVGQANPYRNIDTPIALMRGILGSLTQVVLAGIFTNQDRA